jgi:glycerol-3-phosphate dehydrogenase (NAD(P)+)
MSSLAVIGAGAWGRALAVQAARTGAAVRHLAARGTGLPPDGCDAILVAPSLQHLRATLARLPAGAAPLVLCAKGIETGTLRLPLEIAAETHPGRAAAVLTGPNFAHEVAAGLPTATVLAAADAGLRDRLAGLLATPAFRVYGNDDPVGAQVGGAAKNVIAIAAGAVIGAGLGENARAALITRGVAELSRAAVALGGRAETVMGLSGLGDLLLTCTGPASRNYSLGLALGRGERLTDVLAARTEVTEGVATAPALVARLRHVDMPICRAVAALLAGETTLADAITSLLARPRRDE